jgi:hypothetical protein
MSVIAINGKTYRHNGKIFIVNGGILVNGKKVENYEELEEDQKHINIEIHGEVEKIDVDVCDTITVNGNVKNIKTMSGDVYVKGDVEGGIKTMSGDVDCGNVSGDVSSISGDIK